MYNDIVLANLFAVATRWMRFLQNVPSESEYINHLEMPALCRHRERRCIVRKIWTVSDTGEFEARCQFIQLIQYQHGNSRLIISDCMQMRVARIDIWVRQQILDHRRVSLADSDMQRADALKI